MFRRILPVFLCLALPLGSGCARSYDGTVIIPKPLDVRRFWDRPSPQAQAEQSQLETDVFPVAPQTPKRPAMRRSAASVAAPRRRVANNPPMLTSQPAKPLTCRNVSEPGKRARMVCE
ncbi:MAG: hypothetical protein E5W70_06595 [Mesorhizobium sp.]|uniref:hypothetical protein n=1 Tax=Mesorhizobium sp. TaxID=1871066 RepID=UPI0011FCC3D7|nr:hypothetical protein [Mesorhizobium sp.]TIT23758.1 MAG: hypothetical protein E5W70_06595 [Mesorhizobium sp.]